MRGAVPVLLLILAGCDADPVPIRTCADSLAGSWRSEAGTYHALDQGRSIDFHPLFDSAKPGSGRSAWMLNFQRGPADTPAGSVGFFLSREDKSCRIRWPATLQSCKDDRLVITYSSGPLSCGAAPRDGSIELVLTR